MLEGFGRLDRLCRRNAREHAKSYLRASGLCVRCEAQNGSTRARDLERCGLGRGAGAAGGLLKRQFNIDFWIPERRFFALGLDGQKRRIDSLTSNIGHLLWSGIADEDKARDCVGHLMQDALFSGWGVRTMAMGEGSYNPIGYHVGTVWPHDNSIIAWGLRRYGYREEAARIALAILEAAELFHHRLPEAFAGYARERTKYPVEYPTACSPQAWATGAPLLLLRALLGLESDGKHLITDPALPERIDRIELLDVPGVWGHMDAFGRAQGNRRCAAKSGQPAR